MAGSDLKNSAGSQAAPLIAKTQTPAASTKTEKGGQHDVGRSRRSREVKSDLKKWAPSSVVRPRVLKLENLVSKTALVQEDQVPNTLRVKIGAQ